MEQELKQTTLDLSSRYENTLLYETPSIPARDTRLSPRYSCGVN